MIVVKNVEKTYLTKLNNAVKAIKNANLIFDKNEMIFILGQSGSGKTTLLNLLGGIDSQTSGEILIDNKKLGEDISLEAYRQNYVGFVFQEYNLINNLNVFDNVALALSTTGREKRDDAVIKALEKVGLKGFEKRKINELSGGQKQRVAIARAIAKNSQILLCDEPTGNLDSKTGKEIFELLKELSSEKIVIVVSHNEELATKFADRIINITDGEIFETYKEEKLQIEATKINKKEILNNSVPFAHVFKLSLKNLLSHKFKTVISFCLLFLSLFSVSIMQICFSYDSEKTIANATKKESTVVLVNNKNSQEFALNTESNEINVDLLSPIDAQNYQKLYTSKYGRFFITDNNNSVINNKEFYFKNSLSNNSAYITDFFADYTLKHNTNYQTIEFDNYLELENVEIKYNGVALYKIAGVIKTDYQEFFDKNALTFEIIDQFRFNPDKIENYLYNINYKYNVTYVNLDTFNNFDLYSSVYYLNASNNFKTEINVNDKKQSLSELKVSDTDNITTTFLSSDGFIKTNDSQFSNELIKHRQIADNEAIINGKLYNYLFDENINWVQVNEDYHDKNSNNVTFYKQLEHLNTQIDFSILKNDKTISSLNNVTIVGVDFSNSSKYYEESFSIYLKAEQVTLKNTDKQTNFAVEINLSQIDNAKTFFNNLRNDNFLVAGAVARSAYEKEYFIRYMGYFFIAITIVFTLITFLAMINLVNTKIKDNKRQIGILMGIGFTQKDILKVFLLSISYLIILNVILIIPCVYLSAHIVNNLLLIESLGFIQFFSVNLSTFIVLCGSSLILFIFSAFPLISFLKKKPIEVINDNE